MTDTYTPEVYGPDSLETKSETLKKLYIAALSTVNRGNPEKMTNQTFYGLFQESAFGDRPILVAIFMMKYDAMDALDKLIYGSYHGYVKTVEISWSTWVSIRDQQDGEKQMEEY